MKTIKSLTALLATLAVLGLSVSAQAQSNIPGNLASEGQLVDAKSVKSHAIQTAALSELPKATAQAVSQLSVKDLSEGKATSLKASVMTRATESLLDENTVNVKVSYDARPIGGILNVKVSMTPSFRGIGVATRPVISRSVAQAVDELNDQIVQDLVKELTSEISTEYASAK